MTKTPLSPSRSADRVADTFFQSLNQIKDLSFDNDNVTRLYHDHCTYLPAMLGWFLFSAILTSYNKVVFGNGHMAFPCPLFLTSIHFLVQWTFSHTACALFPEALGTDRVEGMGWKEWALVSIPCGLVTALDVGLSNLSLAVITITFYTMVKSSAPVFVLGWAHLFGIEKITLPLVGVAAVIAIGEFFTVFGEVDFVLKGFLLCLSASILSGARWTIVQLKLQSMDPPLKTTIVTMRLLSPSMFLSMLLLSFVVERPWNVFFHESAHELLRVGLLGLVGGIFAVAMILCEFYLILEASAFILMIGGVIKEMVTILIGYVDFCVEYFQDVPAESNLHQTNNLVFVVQRNRFWRSTKCNQHHRHLHCFLRSDFV
jgi:solute carrier family 35 protein C2